MEISGSLTIQLLDTVVLNDSTAFGPAKDWCEWYQIFVKEEGGESPHISPSVLVGS